ncbi:MAG: hypothetical protein LBQ09_03155 [Acidobacteriaceae bacterium]|jgi:hypothetical protein|nr:hypothetical protein [Acidobacteriaceae bacterium]
MFPAHHEHDDTTPPVLLNVAGREWQFSIAGVTRVGRELFVRVVLQSAELCTATVHLQGNVVLGVTAKTILDAMCEWLLMRNNETSVYIDLAATPA